MCDLAKEREKIDAILARATAMEPVRRRSLDHAAIGRNRPIAENVIDSKSIERASSEKPASTFSQRALDRSELIERGLSALREHYDDSCSEGCMRERCIQFVDRLIAQRTHQMPARHALPLTPALSKVAMPR